MEQLIVLGTSAQELKQAVLREGMRTLQFSGLDRVSEGATRLDRMQLETPSDAS